MDITRLSLEDDFRRTNSPGQTGIFFSPASGTAGVEGALELTGVAEVFGIGGGEFVGAVHGGAGTEIKVAVTVRIQDGLKAGSVRHTDRTGRETFMQVGVVRRIEL